MLLRRGTKRGVTSLHLSVTLPFVKSGDSHLSGFCHGEAHAWGRGVVRDQGQINARAAASARVLYAFSFLQERSEKHLEIFTIATFEYTLCLTCKMEGLFNVILENILWDLRKDVNYL